MSDETRAYQGEPLPRADKVQPMGWMVSETYHEVRKIARHLGVDEPRKLTVGEQAQALWWVGLRERVEELESINQAHQNRITTLLADNERDRTRVEFLDTQAIELRRKVEAVVAERDELFSQRDELRREREEMLEDLARVGPDRAIPITNEPLLGLATTEMLFRELITRFQMTQYTEVPSITTAGAIQQALILAEMLGGMSATEREYRTIDD